MDPGDQAPADVRADPCDQPPGEEPELSRPRGRLGLNGELSVLELHRPAVAGEVSPDEPVPRAEDPGLGSGSLPAARLHQLLQESPERLWVAWVRAGTGVAPQPPSATSAGVAVGRWSRRAAGTGRV